MPLICLATWACGSEPAPTPAAWRTQAGAVCTRAAAASQGLGGAPRFATATPANLAAADAYLGRFIPVLAEASSSLGALPRPAAQAALIGNVLSRLDDGIGDLRRARTAAAAGDATAFGSDFGAAVRADEDASALDDRLGVPGCEQLLTQPFRTTGAATASPAATGG